MPNLGCFTLPMDVTATATRPVDIESEIPAAAAATTSIATPPHTHPPANSLSFSNGLKRRHPGVAPPKPVVLVSYKECLKNHAASLGGHALDGCGEFMPSPASTPADPTSLKCAACGCHRNFHRRDPDEPTTHVIEIHRHPPAPPRRSSSSPSPSPPPPHLSSYYSSAPHMLLSLRSGGAGPSDEPQVHPMTVTRQENPNGRKRFRTKFSQEQKEKMLSFAEKLGWKMQKSDEGLVEEFCNEAGVRKGVLKVWMHNNKHTFGKRDIRSSNDNNNNNGDNIISFSITNGHNNNTNGYNNQNEEKTTSVDDHHEQNHLSTNGSSSSS